MHVQKIFQPIVAQGDPTCALLEQWDVNQNHVSPSLIGSYSKKNILLNRKQVDINYIFIKLKFRVDIETGCKFIDTKMSFAHT